MDRAYFEAMYANDPDPWGFDTDFYEHRKYDLTVAALTRPVYRSAFEPGCSNGALTERLALRCSKLVACDIIDETVQRARRRVARFDHVHVAAASFPTSWPAGELDLVVWSEVAYYLGPTSMTEALDGLDDHLAHDGDLVVVNFTGPTNYPQSADDVDTRIEQSGLVRRHTSLRCDRFRLDVWRR